MDTIQIDYFISAVETGSFTKTAQKYLVTQSCVSKQIANLESTIGFTLFLRTSHSIQLTVSGRYFYENMKKHQNHYENIIRMAKKYDTGEYGSVNLGLVNHTVNSDYIDYMIRCIKQQYPNLEINVEQDAVTTIVPRALEGYYDCLITSQCSLATATDYEYIQLYKEAYHIVIHENHPLAKKENLTLLDLAEQEFVSIKTELLYEAHNQIVCLCKAYGFDPKVAKFVKTVESLFLQAEMGKYICLLPTSAAPVDNPKLRFIKIDKECDEKYMKIVFANKKNSINPAIHSIKKVMEKINACT